MKRIGLLLLVALNHSVVLVTPSNMRTDSEQEKEYQGMQSGTGCRSSTLINSIKPLKLFSQENNLA